MKCVPFYSCQCLQRALVNVTEEMLLSFPPAMSLQTLQSCSMSLHFPHFCCCVPDLQLFSQSQIFHFQPLVPVLYTTSHFSQLRFCTLHVQHLYSRSLYFNSSTCTAHLSTTTLTTIPCTVLYFHFYIAPIPYTHHALFSLLQQTSFSLLQPICLGS